MVFKCRSCGSNILYDIASGKLKCEYCGQSFAVEEYSDEEKVFGAAAYRCESCGATLITNEETEATAFCSYCGSAAILKDRLANLRKPDKIIPFAVTAEQCREHYMKAARNAFLAPAWATEEKTVDSFRPIYMPYWRYKVETDVDIEYYKTTEKHKEGNSDIETREPFHTHFTRVEPREMHDASGAFADDISESIGFGDGTEQDMRPFHTGYLSGFYADMADDLANNHEKLVLAAEKAEVEAAIAGLAPGDKLIKADRDCKIAEKELVYCPVWFMSRKNGDKMTYAAVNGQTGKVVADFPISTKKFLGLSAAIAAGVFVLLNGFLTLRPEPAIIVSMVLNIIAMIFCSREHGNLKRVSEQLGIKEPGVPFKKLNTFGFFAIVVMLLTAWLSVSNLKLYAASVLGGIMVIFYSLKTFKMHELISTHKPPQMNRKGAKYDA